MNIYRSIQEFEKTGLVRAATSLRPGGVSQAPYASLNLAEHVEDCPKAVATNREIFFAQAGVKNLVYCHQIHGARVVEAESVIDARETADAIISAKPGSAIGVFTADCVPVFLLDTATPGYRHRARWLARHTCKHRCPHPRANEKNFGHRRGRLPCPPRALHQKMLLYRQHRARRAICGTLRFFCA